MKINNGIQAYLFLRKYLLYLTPLFKSLVTVLFVSYLLMCMVYYSHTGPIGSDIFILNDSYQEQKEQSFLVTQNEIIKHYMNWIGNAIYLDFGRAYPYPPTSVISLITTKMLISSKLIFFSLFIGILISIIFIYINKFKIIAELIIEPVLSFSFSHLLVTIIVFKTIFDIKIGASLLVASILLCFGSGFLSDFYYLLLKEYENIMNKDYAVFAEYSGFSKLLFTMKELVISLISISTSRIPILFGGMIIIEIASSGSMYGIGYLIWEYGFEHQNLRIFYSATIISVFSTSFFFYLADFIDKTILMRK